MDDLILDKITTYLNDVRKYPAVIVICRIQRSAAFQQEAGLIGSTVNYYHNQEHLAQNLLGYVEDSFLADYIRYHVRIYPNRKERMDELETLWGQCQWLDDPEKVLDFIDGKSLSPFHGIRVFRGTGALEVLDWVRWDGRRIY